MKYRKSQFSVKPSLVLFWEGHRDYIPLIGGKFTHCAVVLKTTNNWLFLDPHVNGLEIGRIPLVPIQDLIQAQTTIGRIVLQGTTFDNKVTRPSKKIDCVQFCKFVLGIRSKIIRDPLTLYLFLRLNGFDR